MGSRYSAHVVRDVDLASTLADWRAVGLVVGDSPIPLQEAWSSGGVAQVGANVVAVGPSTRSPVEVAGAGALAARLHAEVCSVAASTVVDYYEWSVVDADGRSVRYWTTDGAGDEAEEHATGDPLPEEGGITLLDEGSIELFLEARTGVRVRGLQSVAAWLPLRVDEEALAAIQEERRRRVPSGGPHGGRSRARATGCCRRPGPRASQRSRHIRVSHLATPIGTIEQ